MSRIPAQFIDLLLSSTDIVDVVDKRVSLKKQGKEFTACCPFHNEKTPSFTVSPDKQFYHCFGCGAHGTVIGFLMEYENLTFLETIESLASDAGIEIPRESTSNNHNYKSRPDKSRQDALFVATELAANWYQNQLKHHVDKHRVHDYLKGRGLSGIICKDFGIGFAPDSWDSLVKSLSTTKELQQALIDVGVIGKSDSGKVYDRFRNRIQFPIHDFKGRVIGFGGRTLGDDKAKYYNSPETELFSKGKELYGLFQARNHIKTECKALVVEGYMDVVSLTQFGVKYSVATLGTATTKEHLKRLFRLTDKIIFCFDGDKAGVKAAVKAMYEVLSILRDGRDAGFVFLPEGYDPDSFIRKHGKDKFEKVVDSSTSLENFIFAYLKKQSLPDTAAGKAKFAELSKPILRQLSSGVYFEHILARLARITEMDVDKLRGFIQANLLNTTIEKKPRPNKSTKKNISNKKLSNKAVNKAVTIIISAPKLALNLYIADIFFESKDKWILFLLFVVDLIKRNPEANGAMIYERLMSIDEAKEKLSELNNSSIYNLNKDQMLAELKETMSNVERNLSLKKNNYKINKIDLKAKEVNDMIEEKQKTLLKKDK